MNKGRPQKKIPDSTIHTREWLESEYWDKNKTQGEIARDSGLAKWTVQNLFREYGIEVRKIKNKHLTKENQKLLNDRDWIHDQYINQGKSTCQIAKETGFSDVNVLKRINQFGIPKTQFCGNQYYKIFSDDSAAMNVLTELNKTKSLAEIADHFNVHPGTVWLWFKKLNLESKQHFNSKEENQIKEFITNELGIQNVVRNSRKLLSGNLEVDIYLPDHQLGVEMNGLYWHAHDKISDSAYHKRKADYAKKAGIKLYQFYDIEWQSKTDIIKSMISHAVGNYQKIHARKTKIVEVPQKVANEFLERNHIQGQTNSRLHLGLECMDGELVSLMSFTKSRFNKNVEWELSRFCSKLGCSVVGGASKLFHHFTTTRSPQSIVSYADRRISEGGLYEILGFKTKETVSPSYYYFYDVGERQLIRKEHFRHSKLPQIMGLEYDPNQTEFQNTSRIPGLRRIYDCGKYRFIWTKTS